MADHTVSQRLQSAFNNFGLKIKEEVDSGLGYQVNGGVDFYLTDSISVGADIYYLWFKPEATFTVSTISGSASLSTKTKVELNSVIGLANIKFHF